MHVSGRLVDANSPTAIVPELVARCRATCIDKFLLDSENTVIPIDECREETHCSMCWDFCQFLYAEKQHVSKGVCTNYTCVSIIGNSIE